MAWPHLEIKQKNKNSANDETHKKNEKFEEGKKDFMMKDFVNKAWNMKLCHETVACQ